MSDPTTPATEQQGAAARSDAPSSAERAGLIGVPLTNPDAGLAAFADAETREILNLLGETDDAGGCCGGDCCSA